MGTSGGRLGSHGDEEKSPQSRRRDEKSVLYAAAAAFLPHKYPLALAVAAAPFPSSMCVFIPATPFFFRSIGENRFYACPPPPLLVRLHRRLHRRRTHLWKEQDRHRPETSSFLIAASLILLLLLALLRIPVRRRRRRSGLSGPGPPPTRADLGGGGGRDSPMFAVLKCQRDPFLCGGDNVTFSELLENVSWSPETTFSSASVVAYKRRFYLLSFRKSPVLLRPGSSVAYLGIRAIKKKREAPFPVSFIGKFPLLASFYFFVGFRGDGGKILPPFSVATATCKNAGGGRRMLPRSRLFFDLSRNRLPRSPTNSKKQNLKMFRCVNFRNLFS